ncbi:hypothetical protein BC937DRAFT_87201 [Endogone sp. FLAS-F59071]|nr:hypothetical protein BC937DRAFT_87201 [Endogone sp. FLAS-F59071]|eukprot:RUS19612.1 hypothetical protein BC937DRAFT_87201 [Endogone sp. FLAS-F59071]
MGENDEKTVQPDTDAPTPRQLQAEAQVARLEREVQDLRGRLKNQSSRASTPLGSRSTKAEDYESKNFQLEEQVKDLKFQLASKHNEISKVQDTLNKRTGRERASLIHLYTSTTMNTVMIAIRLTLSRQRKSKSRLRGQTEEDASLDEYRATIATKDAELDLLRTELAEVKAQEELARSSLDESQSMCSRSPFARILSLAPEEIFLEVGLLCLERSTDEINPPSLSSIDLVEAVERLTSEMNTQAAMYTSQVNQLDSKLRQTNTQLTQTKTEYQQYKQRAHTLLQQKTQEHSGADGGKVAELELVVKRLELEKSDATADLRSTQQRLSLVEQDLHQSFDQIAGLERELERTRRAEKQNAELKLQLAELVAKAKQDKKDAEEGPASFLEPALLVQEQHHATTLQTLRQEIQRSSRDVEDRLAKKEEECEELQRISERLSDELSTLRGDLARRTVEAEELRSSLHPRSSTPADASSAGDRSPTSVKTFPLSDAGGEGNGVMPAGEAGGKWGTGTIYGKFMVYVVVYEYKESGLTSFPCLSKPGTCTYCPKPAASLSDLLSGTGDNGQDALALSAEKEKDYTMKLQHLAELLNESESNVVRLRQQEKVLKEEIRNLDSFDKRQNLSIEYLKNVILKFLQSGDKEREVGTYMEMKRARTATPRASAYETAVPQPDGE